MVQQPSSFLAAHSDQYPSLVATPVLARVRARPSLAMGYHLAAFDRDYCAAVDASTLLEQYLRCPWVVNSGDVAGSVPVAIVFLGLSGFQPLGRAPMWQPALRKVALLVGVNVL